MVIIYFISGGIYTIILLLVGIYLGYTIKQEKIQISKIVDKVTNRQKSDDAGPVKPITKIEREAEVNKGFTDRVKKLTSD